MKDRLSTPKNMLKAFAAFSTVLALSWVSPTLAKDPFRTTNRHQIGDNTEAAFKSIFREGNYTGAESYLQRALSTEPGEPLAYALEAALAYTKKDINSTSLYGQKTLAAAQQLVATDPLRGNLYLAVAHFFQGAVTLANEGSLRGTPDALTELRQVYQYLDKAEAVSATDPELNLFRGYMELLLAVNLPFSSPDQGIDRLAKYAGPKYLADRGLALGYRDLHDYDKALDYVNRALKSAPDNPELFYLKGQILTKQAQTQNNPALYREALKNFDEAIKPQKRAQLPAGIVTQIERERQKNVERLSNSS